MNRSAFALLPLALALAACASPGDFPSLARRPAEGVASTCPIPGERVTGSAAPALAEPAPPTLPAPPGAELSARLAGLVDQARTAHRRFGERRGAAERLVSAGGRAPVASESWAVATVALADLEAARSEAMLALADLDGLHAAERIADPNAERGDSAAISAARDQVMDLVGEEDRVLANLRGRIGG